MRIKPQTPAIFILLVVALLGRPAVVEAGFVCTGFEAEGGMGQVSAMDSGDADLSESVPTSDPVLVHALQIREAVLFSGFGAHGSANGMNSQSIPNAPDSSPISIDMAASDELGPCPVARILADRRTIPRSAILSRLFRPPRP